MIYDAVLSEERLLLTPTLSKAITLRLSILGKDMRTGTASCLAGSDRRLVSELGGKGG